MLLVITWLLYYFACIFYSVLCVFSIVTGILYATGKRKLNTIELSDSFVSKIKDENKFAKKMGIVTIIVGIFQGITATSLILYLLKHREIISWDIPYFYLYLFSYLFTVFSFISVFVKIWNKSSVFAWIKIICYTLIMLALFVGFII